MGAIAKAQGNYKRLIPNEDSSVGKFANLQAILDATRESLSANAVSFFQYIQLLDEGSGAALLHTVLGHDSGQCGLERLRRSAYWDRPPSTRQRSQVQTRHRR